ncbi:exonuclease domain-containing protein [Variovorax sp.]|uniref:3'-5' exonuclease n=1 Tax=Variovorax sp. TaxID=1871043 RepID=UPI003BAD04DB
MNLAFFYDTETTGLPLFKEPSEHPGQPHIVQLGACLVDLDTRVVHSTLDVIVKPEGWDIPDEVAAIHGITTELGAAVGVPEAEAVGVPEAEAVGVFLAMWQRAACRIAHNESFDARILRIALMRHFPACEGEQAWADVWKAGVAQCTQLISTPILKLPPTEKMKRAGFLKHKSANLGEAYQHFTGKPLVGAHSAIVDVRACMDVFFAATAPQPEAIAA